MHHFPESYLIFFASLGWMVVCWTVAPEIVGQRAVWWLIGFSFCNAFHGGIHTTLLKYKFDQQAFLESTPVLFFQVVSATLLLEFFRRVRIPASAPPPGPRLHLFSALCALLVLLGSPFVARLSVQLFTAIVLLTTAGRFWHMAPPGDPRRNPLRLSAAGFVTLAGAMLANLVFEPAPGGWGYLWLLIGGAAAPWLACLGITEALHAQLGTRSYAARGLLFCLVLTPFFTPLIESRLLPHLNATARERALRLVAAGSARFDPAVISRLAAGGATEADLAAIRSQLAALRQGRVPPERAYLWTLRDGRITPLSSPAGGLQRNASATELAAEAAPNAYIRDTVSDGWTDWLSTNSPLAGSGPTVWLALDYRLLAWKQMMETNRYMLTGSLSVTAIFLTLGIVLTWRRALENRRFATLRDTETASRAKTEFLAFLSHEMRTPLQTILGRAELLRPEQSVTRHVAAIEAQGRLLLRLVNDLLDLGTIEAGHFVLYPRAFSLRAAAAHVEDLVRPLASAKELALHLQVAPDVPDGLMGDETRLRQILGNLLTNAVKYTPRGEVRLEVTVENNLPPVLVFRVLDTGPGLPADKIPQLFTLFTRLDAGDTHTREGTGVGLALVSRLCGLMGGSAVALNRPGGGAEFTVRLPFTTAAVPVPMVVPVKAARQSSLTVLVAEDNTAARELLAEGLRQMGHRVTTVSDGNETLAVCQRLAFDAVVLDVNLPGIDGIEIARRLRALPGCPRLIGCSAEVMPATRQAALDAGMAVFLAKPVSLAGLAEALPASTAPNAFDLVRAQTPSTRIRGLVLAELPGLQDQMSAALAAGDWATLRRIAHYLHTSALLLDNPGLPLLCVRLERDAEAADHPAATATFAKLAAALAQCTA